MTTDVDVDVFYHLPGVTSSSTRQTNDDDLMLPPFTFPDHRRNDGRPVSLAEHKAENEAADKADAGIVPTYEHLVEASRRSLARKILVALHKAGTVREDIPYQAEVFIPYSLPESEVAHVVREQLKLDAAIQYTIERGGGRVVFHWGPRKSASGDAPAADGDEE